VLQKQRASPSNAANYPRGVQEGSYTLKQLFPEKKLFFFTLEGILGRAIYT